MQAFRPIWAEVGKTEKLKTIKELIHMTTKQLQEYANKQLAGFKDIFFFVNTKRIIKPYAPDGEKYGIAYNNTYKLIASANNIAEVKEMIDEFVNYYKERDAYYKSEAEKYGYTY